MSQDILLKQVMSSNGAAVNTYRLPIAENVKKLFASSGAAGYITFAIKVVGTTAYIAGGTRGLAIVDISDPANAAQIGSWIPSSGDPTWWPCRASAHIGNTMAICNREGAGRIESIDITNPASPTSINLQTHAAKFSDITTDGISWYVAGQTSGVFKYSNTNPLVLIESNVPGDLWETQGIEFAEINGIGYLFCSNYRWGYRILLASDLTDVANITTKPSIQSTSEDMRPWKSRIKTYGNKTYAFICGNDNELTSPPSRTGLAVLDVTDPYNPVWVNSGNVIEIRTFDDFEWVSTLGDKPDNDIVLYNNYAFIVHGSLGIAAFNIENPEIPVYLGLLNNELDTYSGGQKDNLSSLAVAEINGDVYLLSGDGVHFPNTDGTDQVYIDKLTFV